MWVFALLAGSLRVASLVIFVHRDARPAAKPTRQAPPRTTTWLFEVAGRSKRLIRAALSAHAVGPDAIRHVRGLHKWWGRAAVAALLRTADIACDWARTEPGRSDDSSQFGSYRMNQSPYERGLHSAHR